ncbi:MAG: GFA family protein [Burkholderiaceae bacterium]
MTTKTLTGSCLCGGVRYTVHGEPRQLYHCHCSRCRKATGTGHVSNLVVAGTLTWDAGENLIRRYKVPEAERFTNVFCVECGGRVPRLSPQGDSVNIPAGSLDTDPGVSAGARLFMGSRASWSCHGDSVPAYDELAG